MLFDFWMVFAKIPEILRYLPISLLIALVATLVSLLIGFLVAWVKIKRTKVLKPLADFYVSFTRGTPIIVQLYTTYYGIPFFLTYLDDKLGWDFNVNGIPPIMFALVALALNDAAYSSESIRAAILSVDRGQIEAAHSIGMTSGQTLWRIIIPEAAVVALPTLGNGFINMIKNTSLVFVCGVIEMTAAARLIAGRDYRYFEMYVSLAIIYWIITLIASRLLLLAERKLARDQRGVQPVEGAGQRKPLRNNGAKPARVRARREAAVPEPAGVGARSTSPPVSGSGPASPSRASGDGSPSASGPASDAVQAAAANTPNRARRTKKARR
ncbi:MAG: amino acid ABC transporter permease [Bifidobacteriaceae bacterium]|jgi:polar amino acid transport system permease protein|nr:amino acid ABC transporter permease [Bifidobacteriaceae bacterium]